MPELRKILGLREGQDPPTLKVTITSAKDFPSFSDNFMLVIIHPSGDKSEDMPPIAKFFVRKEFIQNAIDMIGSAE